MFLPPTVGRCCLAAMLKLEYTSRTHYKMYYSTNQRRQNLSKWIKTNFNVDGSVESPWHACNIRKSTILLVHLHIVLSVFHWLCVSNFPLKIPRFFCKIENRSCGSRFVFFRSDEVPDIWYFLNAFSRFSSLTSLKGSIREVFDCDNLISTLYIYPVTFIHVKFCCLEQLTWSNDLLVLQT